MTSPYSMNIDLSTNSSIKNSSSFLKYIVLTSSIFFVISLLVVCIAMVYLVIEYTKFKKLENNNEKKENFKLFIFRKFANKWNKQKNNNRLSESTLNKLEELILENDDNNIND